MSHVMKALNIRRAEVDRRGPDGEEVTGMPSKQVNCRLHMPWFQALDKCARRLDMSRTACAEMLLHAAIEDVHENLFGDEPSNMENGQPAPLILPDYPREGEPIREEVA